MVAKDSMNLFIDIILVLKTNTKLHCKSLKDIRRFMLALQWYDFALNYIPENDAVAPDTPSRAYLNDCKTEISTEDMKAHLQLINKS